MLLYNGLKISKWIFFLLSQLHGLNDSKFLWYNIVTRKRSYDIATACPNFLPWFIFWHNINKLVCSDLIVIEHMQLGHH